MKRGGPLKSDPEKTREWQRRSAKPLARKAMQRKPSTLKRSSTKRRRPVSPASTAQRAKVREALSIVSGQPGCDPAHLWPRSLGGCDDPLCVVPLTRAEHDAYDNGDLDLTPHLIREGCVAELQHALTHTHGSLLRLLERVSGQQWTTKENQ